MNMELDNGTKIELIVTVCNECASILKDPTKGGTVELTADGRTKAREEAFEYLSMCIETLSSIATFNEGFFDIINIASKLKLNVITQ